MRVTTTVVANGGATGFELPPELVAELGGKRVPVVVTVRGYSYRSTTAVMNGRSVLPLAREHREAAGVGAGDEVELEVVPDAAPRTVEVPADLADALAVTGLRGAFDARSFTDRKEAVRQLTSAKAAATRQRRLQRVLDDLRG